MINTIIVPAARYGRIRRGMLLSGRRDTRRTGTHLIKIDNAMLNRLAPLSSPEIIIRTSRTRDAIGGGEVVTQKR